MDFGEGEEGRRGIATRVSKRPGSRGEKEEGNVFRNEWGGWQCRHSGPERKRSSISKELPHIISAADTTFYPRNNNEGKSIRTSLEKKESRKTPFSSQRK